MERCIILNKEQVDALNTRKEKYLDIFDKRNVDFEPKLLADGITYVLPVSVIDSGEFIELYNELKIEGLIPTISIRDVQDNEFINETEVV